MFRVIFKDLSDGVLEEIVCYDMEILVDRLKNLSVKEYELLAIFKV